MTFNNRPFNPKNIAPLNFLGSNFSLNFLMQNEEKIIENLARIVDVSDCFKDQL